jgi:selenocysteine-specific elongation factor
MHVIATAGHVDHGKSALVRALTGMEPDRWAEERRRGMTIDLGYAWTGLPSGDDLAFVDVPGHERFTTNMLAGVGPVPAVMLVVAADGGWSAQTVEHVAALDALGVRHGLVAVTRSDLADPGPVAADAVERLAATTIGAVEAVAVSSVTGAGLDELRRALGRLVAGLPPPTLAGRVRLWVDRAFTVAGFGTVITGTLGAGHIRVGDTLELGGERVAVRGLERFGRAADDVPAVARVAVNLRARPKEPVRRGQALLTPGAWLMASGVDVRLASGTDRSLARQLVLHIGSAAVPVGVRPLGGRHVRLTLRTPLPLQIGDRALRRDPGLRRIVAGVTVIDPAPPSLAARGAARVRAEALETAGVQPDLAGEVRRRRIVSRQQLAALGVMGGPPPPGVVEQAGWLIDEPQWQSWQTALDELVRRAAHEGERLLRTGVAGPEVVQALELPDPDLLGSLVASRPALEKVDGHVRARGQGRQLDPSIAEAMAPLVARLRTRAFDAPTADDLAAAGLGDRHLGAAAAAGLVLRLPANILLLPDAPRRAEGILRALPQPFTVSAARLALDTTRRVAVPLLEHLDRIGVTRQGQDARRLVLRSQG